MNLQKIHVELVPQSCFFTNVRSQVSTADWDIIRKEAYRKADWKCEVCGGKGRMEAHEIWHYDDKKLIQKLFKIVSLCGPCHQVYHLGFASISGKLPQAIKRLAKLNSWSMPETQAYVEAVFEIFYQRSQKQWKLDLTLLDKMNIKYSLIKPKDRIRVSDKKLKDS